MTTEQTDSHSEGPVGLVVVNTGNGKGKTTAALGVLFRAFGQGLKVAMFQFIKTKTSNYGENRAARKLEIEMTPLGDGFTWMSKDIERTSALNREGWELAKTRLQDAAYDVVILDELTYVINYGWLEIGEVLDALRSRPPRMHVIVTGRNAPEELIEYADLVTEMREVKHPYKSGVRAQRGLEF
ncbi:MAG: cob(I)yrinic acid a,c-diamide adenosyltransferase [Chloroflexi bacterium]|nr:cob(I)yrinic acid a,c-diamide adenosyltransferase [Chloroflexota bacterium]